MILAIVLAVVGLAAILVGALGWAGKLPGNSVVGIHVPEVRKSKELWDLAHRIAGPLWVFSGVLFLFAAAFVTVVSGWAYLAPAALVVGALAAIGAGAGRAAHTVAAVDARRIIESESDTTPKVNMQALRRAAKNIDD